ncbi:hypothetical protein C8Q76DRAFT_620734, partial [Earliella scabrosa]
LQPELQGLLVDSMDITSLMAWRGVCRSTYAESIGSVDRFNRTMLQPFFPTPEPFFQLLSEHRAVIGGVAAVSFVLRDPGLRAPILEVYVGNRHFDVFVNGLVTCPSNGTNIRRVRASDSSPSFLRDRDIVSSTALYMKSGVVAVIYRSASISACAPFGRFPTSALMTFITQHTFACAYPALTLNRRTLVADIRMSGCCDTDYLTMGHLVRHGFDFAVNPCSWPEYRTGPSLPGQATTYVCQRFRFTCPQQGRYFGDGGSLVGYMDPLGDGFHEVNVLNLPPFGPMVVWRLHTTYNCTNSCDSTDPLLHEWVTSTPVLILPSAFTSVAVPRSTAAGILRSSELEVQPRGVVTEGE